MLEKKPIYRAPSNVVYKIDGDSLGLDDSFAEAARVSIRSKLETKTLEIPRIPQVAARLLELSNKSNSSIEDFEQLIETDPALATRLLTIANSAAYGSASRIDGLKPALMLLGLKVVEDIVFAESIRLRVFSARSYRDLLEQSWKLSLGTAIACEAISRATDLERDSAFLLGLLHDTGKPVLVNAVVDYEKQNGGRALGADMVELLIMQLHEEIGAFVLKDWGMAESIVDAAGGHHRYGGTGKATSANCLVYAGNLVCQHLGIGDVQRDIDFTLEHVFSDLKFTDFEQISPILETVSSQMDSMIAGLN